MTHLNERKIESKMKRAILASMMMLLFYVQMWGEQAPHFTQGTELFVVAQSGLTMRLAPNRSAPSLGVVEYGSSVVVLDQPDSLHVNENIEWVEGSWLYVDVDGVYGYMFDGYLSDLPLPIYEFEMCQVDMNLTYPLQSWSEINLGEGETDTLRAGALTKTSTLFEGGDRLIQTLKNQEHTLELTLSGVRMMDAYHLLLSMLDGKSSVATFKELSTFMVGENHEVNKIVIGIDQPVKITKISGGDVKITITATDYICGL